MVTPSSSLKAPVPAAEAPRDSSVAHPRPFRITGRTRVLFFLTAWLVVLMPFLFWWGTWFGRPLSDKQIGEYLNDEKHPRHIQHALVWLGDRMARRDGAAKRWYPDIARLSAHPVEEVRNTDAWVMGQDTASQAFHDALLKMLQDPSIIVRGNAALSLVRFGDSSGRSQIVALLQPAKILAPAGAASSMRANRALPSIRVASLPNLATALNRRRKYAHPSLAESVPSMSQQE